jgi:hypothetical protein
MFRRFHHGHSAVGGFVLALALIGHTLWIVTAAVVLGVVIGRAWATWTLWASALRDKWHLSKREKISSGLVPVYSIAALKRRAKSQSDDIPF